MASGCLSYYKVHAGGTTPDRSLHFDNQGTASSNARQVLTILAANQRVQADSHPFQLMKLPVELRGQVYRELLAGGGRTMVVSADSVLSIWSRSCSVEGPSVHGKDITTVLLHTNRSIYNEALPVLY